VRSTLVLSVTTPDNAKYGYTPVTTTHAYGDIVKLDTLKVGDYKLKYVVHDHAGMYGNSGNDNPAELDAVITVRDTVKPTITINGDSDMTHECATPCFMLAEATALSRVRRQSHWEKVPRHSALPTTTTSTSPKTPCASRCRRTRSSPMKA
jgi:hypothetical protein